MNFISVYFVLYSGIDNLCRAVASDLAAFEIFGLAFSLHSFVGPTTGSRGHTQTHDPWLSQLFARYSRVPSCAITYVQISSEQISELVCIAAGLLSFYTCRLLGDGFCVFAVINTITCSAQLVGRNSQYCFDVHRPTCSQFMSIVHKLSETVSV